HFLRLAAQAAGLLDARLGRARPTARTPSFHRLDPDEALRRLFVAWWWKGAWDLLSAGAPAELRLEADRLSSANALLALGTGKRTLARIGERLRETVLPGVGPSSHPAFSDEAWAFAAWRLCLEPLAAFDGAMPIHEIEDIAGHPFKELAAVRITAAGRRLLTAAIDGAPTERPRVRRGMRAPFPWRPTNARGGDPSDAADDGERRARILAQHPEYRAAIDRGDEMVGDVNPRLHVVLHEAVEEQLASGELAEVRATQARLIGLGYPEHDVVHGIGDAFTRELWRARDAHELFDRARYAARLAALPDPSDEAEAAPPLPLARLAPADRERLRALPRSGNAWEGDLSDLGVEIADLGAPLVALWADTADGAIRAVRPEVAPDPGPLLLAAFVDAALRPKAGRAELPARALVHPELAAALRDALASIDVTIEEAEELPLAHGVLDSLSSFLAEPGPRRRRRARRPRRR
ncbi:MAG TPA: DUF1841 family protein, partial [Candidatus Limnocylindria bacterium]|nr:DUF1841 family protein [Candidatus Limnocylindria bacterium]